MTRGTRLKIVLRKIANMSDSGTSLDAIGVLIHVNRATLDGWYKGRNIDNDALGRIAQLGGNVEYILYGEGAPIKKKSSADTAGAVDGQGDELDSNFVRLIRSLSNFHAATAQYDSAKNQQKWALACVLLATEFEKETESCQQKSRRSESFLNRFAAG